MLHPIISGNKFRKLKYNLIEAKRKRTDTLVTFGGAFSNHILAVAAAGKENGQIVLHYRDLEQLDDVLRLLSGG